MVPTETKYKRLTPLSYIVQHIADASIMDTAYIFAAKSVIRGRVVLTGTVEWLTMAAF